MTEVEHLIYQYDHPQRKIILFFHKMLTTEFLLTDKVTFKNPCYYKKSWICYLKPIKNVKVELAFMRGNELSNDQGILRSNGRKQLRSVEIADLKEIQIDIIKDILNEAIHLDDIKPYGSKRKQKKL